MKRHITTRDTTHTRNGYTVTLPAGTPVEPAGVEHYGPQDRAKFFWVSPSVFPPNSLERRDAKYYGFRVSADDVSEC